MKLYRLFFAVFWLMSGITARAEGDVALITALEGKVNRIIDGGVSKMEPFVKLKVGDVLNTTKNSQVQITYFENGRQESWSGAGKLEIMQTESNSTDLSPPRVKQIPLIIVKRLARTPSLDSQGRAGVMRLRAIPSPEEIVSINETYNKMRAESALDDLSPELYFLAGMFELKQFNEVAEKINQLNKNHPKNNQVKVLVSLYNRAIRNTLNARTNNK
ncbi:conserved exported hypothetical protein [Gammaproteobacteria bacterium]